MQSCLTDARPYLIQFVFGRYRVTVTRRFLLQPDRGRELADSPGKQ